MQAIKGAVLIIIGLSTGLVIATAVIAFISMIGIVPRLAAKTKTAQKIRFYENIIMLGGIFGGTYEFFKFSLIVGNVLMALIGFAQGVFVGCLAVSLAEVLDVIPILSRRAKVKQRVAYLILAISVGKMVGSLLYYLVPGFY
ncbi:MAG: stage V sporulation protein AB [Clostridiales bacterium]|nr:stage V sporulation protein AB [Clostridiales bacterium]